MKLRPLSMYKVTACLAMISLTAIGGITAAPAVANVAASPAGGAEKTSASGVGEGRKDLSRSLVPKPAHMMSEGGEGFTLGPESRIVASAEFAEVANIFAGTLRSSTGFDLPVSTIETAGPKDISLTKSPNLNAPEYEGNAEAYRIRSTSQGLAVSATTAHGAFNATQTVRQLFPSFIEFGVPVLGDWSTPAVSILDAPRFPYRGVMVDVARSFQSVDEIKSLIDSMSAHKLSELHLHLADDQGWRIEITNEGKASGDTIDYSLLTEVSGKTAMTQRGFQNQPGITGYYTHADYAEIINYAASRFIEVVPEIDLPGHTNAALHAIPQLNTAGSSFAGTTENPTAPHNGTGSVGYSYLDPESPATFTFITHVIKQLAALTPGRFIHIGGDEPLAMTKRYGHKVFDDFVGKTLDIVHATGKATAGWNEIASSGTVRPGDHVQYWAGDTTDTIEAVKNNGAKVIASRGNSSYLDMKYNPKTPIGTTWACKGICDFPQYYSWDPTDMIPGIPEAGYAGVEGPMWSESIRGLAQAEFLAYPRALSLAEMGWSPKDQRNVEDFTKRMGAYGNRLNAAGINFYDGVSAEWTQDFVGAIALAEPEQSTQIVAGWLSAPGTKIADHGMSISTDTVDDADGMSRTTLMAPLAVSIDWGDGQKSTGTISADTPRSVLSSSGLYAVNGEHKYAAAGKYTGNITASDGRSAAFTVQVGPEALTPSVVLSAEQVDAGNPITVSGTGFSPNERITVDLNSDPVRLATVVADGSGAFAEELLIPNTVTAGDHEVVVSGVASLVEVRVPLRVTAAAIPTQTPTATVTATATPTDGSSPTATASAAATALSTGAAVAPAGPSGPGNGLATTGALLGGWGVGAGVLLLAGLASLMLGRRRKPLH